MREGAGGSGSGRRLRLEAWLKRPSLRRRLRKLAGGDPAAKQGGTGCCLGQAVRAHDLRRCAFPRRHIRHTEVAVTPLGCLAPRKPCADKLPTPGPARCRRTHCGIP